MRPAVVYRTVGLAAALAVAALVAEQLMTLLLVVLVVIIVSLPLSAAASFARPPAEDVMARVRTAWLGWMAAVGLDMLVLGGLLFLGLEIIGLNFAIGFAVFSAFMTVIPNYGSVISAIPPILDGLAHSPPRRCLC